MIARSAEREPEGVSPTARRSRWRSAAACVAAGALAAVPLVGTASPLQAQGNFRNPPSEIERYLESEPFSVATLRGARFPDDPTKQVTLKFEDGTRMLAKWAPAPKGGHRFNAAPRYEAAAYRLQKLFLDEEEYVVPPTICRCVPVWVYDGLDEEPGDDEATFDDSSCVLVGLQAWLWSVTDENVFDRERFRRDTAYARHLANLNVLTYLVAHKDANKGNFLVSRNSDRPRVFAVDNGVAFGSQESNRGTDWRRMRVDRVPRETVERLRQIDRGDLRERLATFAQFEETEGRGMVRVEPEEPLAAGKGIRRGDGVLQIGLTRDEIDGVHSRLRKLLRRVDRGDISTF